MQIFIFVI